MKAVQLESYNQNIIRVLKGLKPSELHLPKPASDEVLVKITAAPCNPSDIAFMLGGYNIKKELPKVLGFEGSGIVVEAGSDPGAQALISKKVSCFTQDDGHGTWAEYFLTKKDNCIEVPGDFDMEQAACISINPFTAYGLMDLIDSNTCKTIIQTAASGQVARFIRHLALERSLHTINIVRKDKHAEQLKEEGQQYVLNLNDEDFDEKLKSMAHELNATVAFEAIGGEMTGRIFNAMPPDSKVILYGGLSSLPVSQVDSLHLIFKGKSIKGFNLNQWMANLSSEKKKSITDEIIGLVNKGNFKTNIQSRFSFDDIFDGLRQYLGNMSEGKVLFVP